MSGLASKLLTASCSPTKDCMLLEKVLSSTLTSAAGVLVRIRHVVAVGVEVQALQRLPAGANIEEATLRGV